MQDEIKNIGDRNFQYIPLAEAGKTLNTSRDYMNVLVRRGKLRAVKFGRNWVTTKEWIAEYCDSLNISKFKDLKISRLHQDYGGQAKFRDSNISRFRDLDISDLSAEALAKAEKDEFKNLKRGLVLEREKLLEAKALTAILLTPEIQLSSRELKVEERKDILESVSNQFKKVDASEFERVSRRWGILKSLRQRSYLKLAAASLAIVLLAAAIGFAGLDISKFKDFEILGNKFSASVFSDVFSAKGGPASGWKNFPNDIPLFYKWFTDGAIHSLAFLKLKTPFELAIGELPGGSSKIIKPQEAPPRIDTFDEALALDLPSEALAKEGAEFGIPGVPVSTSQFTLIENRLSIVETNLKEQKAITDSEFSLQKKTILGTLETLIGISKLLPTYPISTIVVQGQPATLTTYSVQPSVHSGFDRLSASYLTLSNNAEINGSLTVKSGGTFNTLSVSGATTLTGGVTIGGALSVAGDSTLENVTINGILSIPGSTSLGNASTTYLTVSNTAWIANGTITNASTTYATLPTFWSTNGTITNASSTYLSVSDTAWIASVKTPLIWNSGALTASTTGANPIIFAANSSERMRIDESGKIFIATTTMPSGFGANIATSTFVYGDQFISGGLGVGIATTTNGAIQTTGDVFVGRNLRVSGSSTVIGGSSSDTLTVNSSVGSNLVPTLNNFYNLGSPSFYWGNLYVNTLNANNISGASTTISGTQSKDFTINTDNESVDQESMNLIFFRGTVPPNAVISWNAATTSKRFEFNQAARFFNESASTTNPVLTVQGNTGLTANAFQVLDVATTTTLFSVNPVSQKTTMVNASTTNLTVSGNAWINSLTVSGSGGAILLPDGTVSNPSLSFTSDTDTGLFRIGDGKMSFATNATTSLTLDTGKVIVGNDLFTASYQLEVADRDANNNTIVDELRLSHFTTGTADNGLGTGLLFYGQDSTGAGQNLARVAAQVEQADPSNGFLSRLIFSTFGGGSLLEKMRITGNGQLLLATTTVPSGYGANIATSTHIYGALTVSNNSNLYSASTTYATLPTFWSSNANITGGTITGITDLTVADGGTGASTLTGLLQGNGTSAITGVTGTAGQIPYYNGTNTLLATSTIFLATSGNVGIGTTSPQTKLEVTNTSSGATADQIYLTNLASATSTASRLTFRTSDIFGATGTSTAAITGILTQNWTTGKGDLAFSTLRSGALTEAMRINDLGYLGLGTTSPGSLLSVAGHCVTGDTKLRRRKKRRGKNGSPRSGGAGEIEYEYDEIEIKNIQSGDEILSLNEKTGQLVWSRVNALMDMGVKPIYKLTTASGKTIRTTGNHPYLTKYGWVKVWDLREGNEIALPAQEALMTVGSAFNFSCVHDNCAVFDIKRNSEISDAEAMSGGREINKRFSPMKWIFLNSVPFQFIFNAFLNFRRKLFELAFAFGRKLNFPNHKKLGDYKLNSALILSNGINPFRFASSMPLSNSFAYPGFIGSCDSSSSISQPAGLTDLEWYSSLDKRSTNCSSISDKTSSRAKVSKINNWGTPLRSTTTPAREFFSSGKTDFGANLSQGINLASDSFVGNNFFLSICRKFSKEMGRLSNNGSDILWDRIIKIEHLPAERVYDIEIEGTHNFVANGIIAHNTYLSGNLTVSGTTNLQGISLTNASSTYLTVSDTAWINKLNVTNTTSTSTITGGLTVGNNGALVVNSGAAANSLFIAPNGNVGIGTTTPASKLDVYGSGFSQISATEFGTTNQTGGVSVNNDTGKYLRIEVAGSTSGLTGLAQNDADLYAQNNLQFGTNGSRVPVMFLSTTGNVGIGTTSPYQLLSTSKSINGQAVVFLGSNPNTGTAAYADLYVQSSDTEARIIAVPSNYSTPSVANDAEFYTSTASHLSLRNVTAGGDIRFLIGSNTKLTMDSSGNVGIGTTSPSVTLEVRNTANGGGINIDNTTNGGYILSNSATQKAIIGLALGAGAFTTNSAVNDLVIRTNDSTNGNILFAPQAGALEAMRITRAGNVGIGTTSPGSLLHVSGSGSNRILTMEVADSGNQPVIRTRASFGGTNIETVMASWATDAVGTSIGISRASLGELFWNSVSNAAIYTSSNAPIAFGTNGLERMRITGTGNVGIGTTTPNNLLTISGATTPSVSLTTNTGNSGWVFGIDTADANKFKIASSTSSLTSNTRLTIDGNGNVGIGTTGPNGKLQVSGGAIVLDNAQFIAGRNLANSANINIAQVDTGNFVQLGAGSSNNNGMTFFTGSSATERMRINSSGNVGIGTTTPNNLLTISAATTPAVSLTTNTGNSGWVFGIDTADANKFKIASSTLSLTSNTRLTIDGNGNVGIGTTSPTQILSVQGNILTSGCLKVKGAADTGTCVDLAESYPISESVEAGDIVMLDPNSPVHIKKATNGAVIGIVSTRPSILINGDSTLFGGSTPLPFASSTAPVSLAGRVPVKVSLENGPIAIGDRISASSVAGVGKKASSTEATVGMALEAFDGTTPSSTSDVGGTLTSDVIPGVGKILIFVNLGQPQLAAKQGTIDLATITSDLNLDGHSLLNVKSISGLNGLWKIDENGNITAQSVETQKLTVVGAASGVTVYDRGNGAPKCIYIEGGVIKASDGACGATTNPGAPAVIAPASSPVPPATAPLATTTPPTSTTTPATETATSTPAVATSTEPVIVSTTTTATATSTP